MDVIAVVHAEEISGTIQTPRVSSLRKSAGNDISSEPEARQLLLVGSGDAPLGTKPSTLADRITSTDIEQEAENSLRLESSVACSAENQTLSVANTTQRFVYLGE